MRTTEKQETLELTILKTISTQKLHGYSIAQQIHRSENDLLELSGSLYPALYRMEARGLISSEWSMTDNKRRAKFYKLTRRGRRQIKAESTYRKRLSRSVMTRLAPT